MRLLFIKLKHIGDALLMSPMLTAVRSRYPESEIHVVLRHGTEDILKGCPAIDRLHTAPATSCDRKSAAWWDDLKLIMRLRTVRFDYAFELGDGDRGRLLAWLSKARSKCTNDTRPPMNRWWRACFTHVGTESWKGRHRVEKDYSIVRQHLDLPDEIPPLCFEKNANEPLPYAANEPYLVFHPATRWRQKRWPCENWIRLGQSLVKKYSICVSSGPDPGEIAEAESIAEGIGPTAEATGGRLSWAQLAGLIRGAKLFVGVDTSAMHLAAACQCPIVAIFGPSREWAWHPWMAPHEVVAPPSEFWPTRQSADVVQCLKTIIQKVEVPSVLQACQTMLAQNSNTRRARPLAYDGDTSSYNPTPES